MFGGILLTVYGGSDRLCSPSLRYAHLFVFISDQFLEKRDVGLYPRQIGTNVMFSSTFLLPIHTSARRRSYVWVMASRHSVEITFSFYIILQSKCRRSGIVKVFYASTEKKKVDIRTPISVTTRHGRYGECILLDFGIPPFMEREYPRLSCFGFLLFGWCPQNAEVEKYTCTFHELSYQLPTLMLMM